MNKKDTMTNILKATNTELSPKRSAFDMTIITMTTIHVGMSVAGKK